MVPVRTRFRIGSGGVLYLMVSGVILASALYTQANLLFWGFGLMVGGLVLAVLMSAIALRGLSVVRLVATHAAAGESLALGYRVENRSWWPAFALVLHEGWGRGRRGWRKVGPAAGDDGVLGGPPHAWVLHVGPRQSTQTQAPCWPRRRGRLCFERVEISTSFPFGVIHKTVVFEQADEVLVFPHLYRVKRDLMSNLSVADGDGRHAVERGGGNEEFFGLREYRPGDGLRVIDWKRTARTGTLAARELTHPSPPKLSLVLDLREPPTVDASDQPSKQEKRTAPAIARQLEERAISLTASIICEAHLQGIGVGLRVLGPGGGEYRPRHSLPHRTRLLEALAKLDLDDRSEPGRAMTDVGRADVVVWAGRGTTRATRQSGESERGWGEGAGADQEEATAPCHRSALRGEEKTIGAGVSKETLSPGGVSRRVSGGGSGGVMVVGAADFERYVTSPTALRELEIAEPRSQTAARRGASPRLNTQAGVGQGGQG